MKRALSTMVMLLFLVPFPGMADAGSSVESWAADKVLSENLTLPAGTALSVEAGVKVSFSPIPAGSEEAVVLLDVGGGLEVCGTADGPVSFTGPDPAAAPPGGWAAGLQIEGDGNAGQLEVRNCTFLHLTVDILGAAGEFRDCSFNATEVYAGDCAVRFIDCTFLNSTASFYNPETRNLSALSGCRFEAPGRQLSDTFDAVTVSGYVDITACDISGYGNGIASSSGLPSVRDCAVHDCGVGIFLDTTDPADTPVIENCSVRDCLRTGVMASGNLRLLNSTIENSTNGLTLSYLGSGASPFNWSLGGDRLWNNSGFGILLYGDDVDQLDTLFDYGAGHPNGQGRVMRFDYILVEVLDPSGSTVPSCNITVTDATGNARHVNGVPGDIPFGQVKDYLVDNSGARFDYYPYNITVESLGVSNSTVLSGPVGTVTMVLALLPELAPSGLQLSLPSPRAGDYVSFRFQASNSGALVSGLTTALFILDGRTLDEVQVFPLTPDHPVPVYSVEWKAASGAHRIQVRLDPGNLVDENDETNNNLTLDFTVRPAPAAPAGVPYMQLIGAGALMIVAFAVGFRVARLRRGRREGA